MRLRLGLICALVCASFAVAADAPAKTTWLCRPGMAGDLCRVGLGTSTFTPAGQLVGTGDPGVPRRPAIDCFYVYPTVSDQPGVQATLSVDPEIRSIALFQAARYRERCRVFAPLYRQVTIRGLNAPAAQLGPAVRSAYRDVLAAWRLYLRRYNRGRGVVLIGHSQGTGHLIELIRTQIDPRPSVRRRLVSAILLGGNMTVRRGRDVGGAFKRIPACRARTQTGCVVAFSTFGEPPPPTSFFGRDNPLFASAFGHPVTTGEEGLCNNPAALRGGAAALQTVAPSTPYAPGTSIGLAIALTGVVVPQASTPWVAVPGAYSGRCSSTGPVNVLQVSPQGGAPALHASPAAEWGLHLVDGNIALGDLVGLVGAQSRAYARRR